MLRKIVDKLVNGFIFIYRTVFLIFRLPKKKNAIIIAYQAIYRLDAIGYDSLKQYEVLKKNGHHTYLYAEKFDRSLFHKILVRRQFNSLIKEKNNTLVLHYGNFWPGVEEIIARANCRIVIKYHNITPSKYFKAYNPDIAGEIEKGYRQIRAIAKSRKIRLYLPDSAYNGQQLQKMGVKTDRLAVIPPFHKTDLFERVAENKKLKRKLRNGSINILFVGRIAPNKGHIHLIETINTYIKKYKARNICLHIVGGIAVQAYYEKLISMVNKYDMLNNVCFAGQVDMRGLSTYYRNSHVFLLMSEHEGFCVPLLEAQYHGIPIVSLDRTAVRGTLGRGQCIHTRLDYSLFADSINRIINDGGYRKKIIDSGHNNYRWFSSEIISENFLNIINGMIHGK